MRKKALKSKAKKQGLRHTSMMLVKGMGDVGKLGCPGQE